MSSSRNKRWEDPIVAEVHEIRRQIMAEHDNDLGKYFASLMQRQAESGRKYVKALTGRSRALRRGGKITASVARAKRAAGPR
jgi:hypothetical protein